MYFTFKATRGEKCTFKAFVSFVSKLGNLGKLNIEECNQETQDK